MTVEPTCQPDIIVTLDVEHAAPSSLLARSKIRRRSRSSRWRSRSKQKIRIILKCAMDIVSYGRA